MAWQAGQAAPRCGCGCGKAVYPLEKFLVADRKVYHRGCLKCDTCHKQLTPASLNTLVEEAKIFCQVCYNIVIAESTAPSSVPVPEKLKMQVLPIGGGFKVEPKEIPKEGPTPEQVKHQKTQQARVKAWEEMKKITEDPMEHKSVRLNDLLSW